LFFVQGDRGVLNSNRAESTILVYRVKDIEKAFQSSGVTQDPAPFWIIKRATYEYGPIVDNGPFGWRWLRDSTGIAFLAKTRSGKAQLNLADITSRRVIALTPDTQEVTGFDVESASRYVYTVPSPKILQRASIDKSAPAVIGTAKSLDSLLFRDNPLQTDIFFNDLSELWAVVDGNRFVAMDKRTHRPLPLHMPGIRSLALSPDGHSLVTSMMVCDVPSEWERIYARGPMTDTRGIKAGPEDCYSFAGQRATHEFVIVGLDTGEVNPVTQAPTGLSAGWGGHSVARWSSDGETVVLTNTFISEKARPSPALPCVVAVARMRTGDVTCLQATAPERNGDENVHRRFILDADFDRGDPNTVTATDIGEADGSESTQSFARQPDGSWKARSVSEPPEESRQRIQVVIREDMNEPPLLSAIDKTNNSTRTLWDPNPQLKSIKFGNVSTLAWKDKSGRDWTGGLYEPLDYVPGHRYPIVIQTHGWWPKKFYPNGTPWPTVFAAQELAAHGIVVLQSIEDCPSEGDIDSPREGACVVGGFEGAVQKLVDDGIIDPERTGIIGFSRTCYHTLVALTTSTLKFRAALIADGVNMGYMQYLSLLDVANNVHARDAEGMNGAAPFGKGSDVWQKRAPTYNMDRVDTPLEVVATTPGGSLFLMWEPYATLRYQGKPVDLVVFDSLEHVFSNPRERLLSQGLTVDWFRFWLQGYEDPDLAKVEQYRRWEQLCDMQVEQNPSQPAFCVRSKPH